MRRVKWAPLALLLVGVGVLSVAVADADDAAAKKESGLDRLKRLEGTWVQVGEDGAPTDTIVSRARITSGGSAIVEEIFPGSEHEMLTVYHLDGNDVLLTHYCALGNAPRMKLQSSDDPEVWTFVCDGHGTNLAETDPHMHAGTFTWDGADRFHGAWTMHAGGKAGQTVEIDAVRRK